MKRAREHDETPEHLAKKARIHVDIGDIDDGCLLSIFKQLTPLPDLFQVAATCKRFRALASDSRLSVLVTQHTVDEQQRSSGRRIVSTLQAAIDISKAGDCIILAPDQVHSASDIVICRPLKLLGPGSTPGSSKLFCPKGAEAALDFRCTAKVSNVTITAMFSNCILHRQGRVTIDSCQLECYAAGLGHLFSPLTTMAVSGLSRQQRLQATLRKQEVGMGVLSVSETLIRGGAGASAVKCSGTGILQSVRVIHLSRDTYFWFEVHSGKQGHVADQASATASKPVLCPPFAQTSQHQESGATLVQQKHSVVTAENISSIPNADTMVQRAKAWNIARHAHLASLIELQPVSSPLTCCRAEHVMDTQPAA